MYELMSRECDQCLMSKNRIVSGDGAAKVIAETRRKDCSFICHKSPRGRQIACCGHHDKIGGQMARIAGRLGVIVEIDPATLAKNEGRA